MKFIFIRALAVLIGLAGLLSTASATLPYADGDLLLGVRATAIPGSNQDYVINLGSASQFTGATAPFVVSGLDGLATDLAIFSENGGAAWSSRADVYWGIVGTDLASDPANTLYATKPRTAANTPTTAWPRRANGSQSGTNSTIRAFISGFRLSTATPSNAKATIQSTTAINSYASFTAEGADFGFFSGIEGTFANGAAGSVLDLYRLAPTTQNSAGAGTIYVGSFQLTDAGALTFTPGPPPPPSFRLSAPVYNVDENAGTVTIRVLRGGTTSGVDTVQFDTVDGTAVAGTDYTAKTGFSVAFAANETQVDVPVSIANIAGAQASRTLSVTLSNPSAGALDFPNAATVAIHDSTPVNAGQIAFGAATFSFPPVTTGGTPNSLAITLNRTGGTDGAVSVDLSLATGGTLVNGTDFTNIASPVTVGFAAGEGTKTFTIQLSAIAAEKLPGTINLALDNPLGGATLGAITTAAITVTASDSVKPTLKLTTKSGKVTSPAFQIAGTVKDNADIDRVEAKVSGGAAQLATLGPLSNGSRTIDLSNIVLENGRNTIVITPFDLSGNAGRSVTLKVTYANSRPALAGRYNGLVTAAGTPTNNTTGYVTLKVTALGAFTGKVLIGAASLPIKGIVDNAGVAHFGVTGDTAVAPTTFALSKKFGAVTTEFGTLALTAGADRITGTLTTGATPVASIGADRAFFDGKTPATTVAAGYLENKGNYTVLFPARETQVGLSPGEYPQGDGIGTLKVTAKGIVTLKGTLADGTPFTSSAPLSKDYHWPLFVKLYKKLGAIAGPVVFDETQVGSDLSGKDIVWIRPQAPGKYYVAGWPNGILTDLFGAKYKNEAGTSVLHGLDATNLETGNAQLEFFDGKLTQNLLATVSIAPTNKVTNAPATKTFSLKLTAASGLFSGKFKHSDLTSPAFKGVIYQKPPTAGGYGFFLSTVPGGGTGGEGGAVTLKPKSTNQ